MEKAKFKIGDKVEIRSILRPDLNTPRTVVIESEYKEDSTCGPLELPYTGWVYWVSANKRCWCESALRKIPRKTDNSFECMISRLKSGDLIDRSGVIVVKKTETEEEAY